MAADSAAVVRQEAGEGMEIISTKDRKRISRAIARAEKKTSGEIVAVIAATSDDYIFIPLLWAALAALTVPLILFPFTDMHVASIYAVQLGVFVVLGLLSQWWPLRIALVPGRIKRARAHRHAVEQFLAQNLHTTKGRTGVLIFVSMAEHFAEVIADEGIYEKVPPETWDRIVEQLTAHIGRQEIANGFVAVIKGCADTLAKHFPPGSGDDNELPDHLIVLE
ncbi:MAG: TPM domain-containing protein [Hyphomicrobiaceae bacterium]|nr:TPM domain-containing protein [Hyphomicrobiaceae bacterium]